jgi:hypothetical protein
MNIVSIVILIAILIKQAESEQGKNGLVVGKEVLRNDLLKLNGYKRALR